VRAVEASLESGLDVELLFCLLGALDNSGGELVGVWDLQAVPPVGAAMFAATRRLPPVITVSVLDASAMAP
jgi:hypothetical protein